MWYIERGGHLQTILSRGYPFKEVAEYHARRRWPGGGWRVLFIMPVD